MTEIHVPQKSHIIGNHYTDHYTAKSALKIHQNLF